MGRKMAESKRDREINNIRDRDKSDGPLHRRYSSPSSSPSPRRKRHAHEEKEDRKKQTRGSRYPDYRPEGGRSRSDHVSDVPRGETLRADDKYSSPCSSRPNPPPPHHKASSSSSSSSHFSSGDLRRTSPPSHTSVSCLERRSENEDLSPPRCREKKNELSSTCKAYETRNAQGTLESPRERVIQSSSSSSSSSSLAKNSSSPSLSNDKRLSNTSRHHISTDAPVTPCLSSSSSLSSSLRHERQPSPSISRPSSSGPGISAVMPSLPPPLSAFSSSRQKKADIRGLVQPPTKKPPPSLPSRLHPQPKNSLLPSAISTSDKRHGNERYFSSQPQSLSSSSSNQKDHDRPTLDDGRGHSGVSTASSLPQPLNQRREEGRELGGGFARLLSTAANAKSLAEKEAYLQQENLRRGAREAEERLSRNHKGRGEHRPLGSRQLDSESLREASAADTPHLSIKQEPDEEINRLRVKRIKREQEEEEETGNQRQRREREGGGEEYDRVNVKLEKRPYNSISDEGREKTFKTEKKFNKEEDYEWGGKADKKSKPQENPKPALKPNFEPSGLLKEEQGEKEETLKNGIPLKHTEPADSAMPTKRWRLYMFKKDRSSQVSTGASAASQEPDKTLHLHRRRSFIFGKDNRVVDILLMHPTISKQHAVLQFRKKLGDVHPYIIDLESTNGTYLNGTKIDTCRYYELREQDVLRFGKSSREFVLLHAGSVTVDLSYRSFLDSRGSHQKEEDQPQQVA
ncbi:fha domain-containing protein [Cystoisospora suis]|uniref:Fha domain-containing protein n=1 Tax=Cystoisospora suis TaxID=483139 RepID=A0A2C6L7I9_9APIC|nr:fha domain-containing protein [Cystoisospora suis]